MRSGWGGRVIKCAAPLKEVNSRRMACFYLELAMERACTDNISTASVSSFALIYLQGGKKKKKRRSKSKLYFLGWFQTLKKLREEEANDVYEAEKKRISAQAGCSTAPLCGGSRV